MNFLVSALFILLLASPHLQALPAASKIYLEGWKSVHLYDLQEDVATVNGTVIYISAWDSEYEREVYEISFEDLNNSRNISSIVTTPFQLIYKSDGSTSQAKWLNIGDTLMKWNGTEFNTASIIEITKLNRTTAVTSVYTSTGWIVVNGIKVSCFENVILEMVAKMYLILYKAATDQLPEAFVWLLESRFCMRFLRIIVRVADFVFQVKGPADNTGRVAPEDI